MGKGNHEGCPYGVWMWWWSSNGFVGMGVWFPNHPYGKSGLDEEGCGGWIPAPAKKTDVGMGSCGRALMVQSRRCGLTGGGYGGWVEGGEGGAIRFDGWRATTRVAPTGYGWGGGRRTGWSVWAGGSRTAPTAQIRRWGMMGKGNHEGCPYGVWMGWWSSNGFVSMGRRFPNRP